jgi:hypothetical protein
MLLHPVTSLSLLASTGDALAVSAIEGCLDELEELLEELGAEFPDQG